MAQSILPRPVAFTQRDVDGVRFMRHHESRHHQERLRDGPDDAAATSDPTDGV
jgi:hypothetical protein